MHLNGEHLIRLPIEDSKPNYLTGFWQWVGFLAADDYLRAVESLHWPEGPSLTPEGLKEAVTSPLGPDDDWTVIVPNERLINVLSEAAEFTPGWFLAHIPLTTQPEDPKNDAIPLFGHAASFFVREYDGSYVMQFEILHL